MTTLRDQELSNTQEKRSAEKHDLLKSEIEKYRLEESPTDSTNPTPQTPSNPLINDNKEPRPFLNPVLQENYFNSELKLFGTNTNILELRDNEKKLLNKLNELARKLAGSRADKTYIKQLNDKLLNDMGTYFQDDGPGPELKNLGSNNSDVTKFLKSLNILNAPDINKLRATTYKKDCQDIRALFKRIKDIRNNIAKMETLENAKIIRSETMKRKDSEELLLIPASDTTKTPDPVLSGSTSHPDFGDSTPDKSKADLYRLTTYKTKDPRDLSKSSPTFSSLSLFTSPKKIQQTPTNTTMHDALDNKHTGAERAESHPTHNNPRPKIQNSSTETINLPYNPLVVSKTSFFARVILAVKNFFYPSKRHSNPTVGRQVDIKHSTAGRTQNKPIDIYSSMHIPRITPHQQPEQKPSNNSGSPKNNSTRTGTFLSRICNLWKSAPPATSQQDSTQSTIPTRKAS